MRLGELRYLIQTMPREASAFNIVFLYPGSVYVGYPPEVVICRVTEGEVASYERISVPSPEDFDQVFDSTLIPMLYGEEQEVGDVFFAIAVCRQGTCPDGDYEALVPPRNLLVDPSPLARIKAMIADTLFPDE